MKLKKNFRGSRSSVFLTTAAMRGRNNRRSVASRSAATIRAHAVAGRNTRSVAASEKNRRQLTDQGKQKELCFFVADFFDDLAAWIFFFMEHRLVTFGIDDAEKAEGIIIGIAELMDTARRNIHRI